MNPQDHKARSTGDLPRATIERNWKTRFIWLIPVAAAALAGWFIYSNLFRHGPTLHIYFDSAAGLQPGKSQVKYRGAEIGVIKDVELTPDQQHVAVTVSLNPSARNVAKEGSRFWIVKPEVTAEEISGLRTIVSGDYITVQPGKGKEKKEFTGLSNAPVIESEHALRIVLIAEKIGTMSPRAPVFYRGIQVGEVVSADLGPASQAIQIRVDIQQRYAALVRMNSKFWNAGGIHVNLNLSGVNIGAHSAETLLSGGIAMATPNTAERIAPAGTEFRFYDKPEDEWLGWAPRIVLEGDEASNHLSATGGSP